MNRFDYIGFIVRLIVLSTLVIGLSFILLCLPGCSEPFEVAPLGHEFELDARLPVDSLGYYHLELSDNWQTLHRLSGQVSPVVASHDLATVYWESSHYWYIGDTLGYVVKRNFNDAGMYVSYDTTYLTQFNGMEVPTSNTVSYSNSLGEINNMIAPVRSMIGDTLTLTAIWYNSEEKFQIVLN